MRLAKWFFWLVLGNSVSLFAVDSVEKYAKSQSYTKESLLKDENIAALLIGFYAQASDNKKIKFRHEGQTVIFVSQTQDVHLSFALFKGKKFDKKKLWHGVDVGIGDHSDFLYVLKYEKELGYKINDQDEALRVKNTVYEIIRGHLEKHFDK